MDNQNSTFNMPGESLNGVVQLVTEETKNKITSTPMQTITPTIYIGYASNADLIEAMDRKFDNSRVYMPIVYTEISAAQSQKEAMNMEGRTFAQKGLGIPILVVVASTAKIRKYDGTMSPQDAIVVTGSTIDNKVSTAYLHTDRMADNTLIVTDTEFDPYIEENGNGIDQSFLAQFFTGFFDEFGKTISIISSEMDSTNFEDTLKNTLEKMSKEIVDETSNNTLSIDDIFD
jgi:hypothetical protein